MSPMPRSAHSSHRGLRDAVTRQDPRPTAVVTLGDLISAACQVTGSPQGAARLLAAPSPLGRLIDRRIVIG